MGEGFIAGYEGIRYERLSAGDLKLSATCHRIQGTVRLELWGFDWSLLAEHRASLSCFTWILKRL